MNGIENATTVATNMDLSIITLFMQATLTVKCVIILLLACSFWSWTVIFAKVSFLNKIRASADKFEEAFWNCGSIETFFDRMKNTGEDPFISVFVTGMKEWRRAKKKQSELSNISTEARINSMMRVAIGREIDELERHVGFLASVGSTAPFVGLFGTVWGIINSFEAIAASQNTSLASVAPGIAEALFATALGLIVSIPAAVGYNKIAADISRYQNRLEAFVDEFSAIISRQIEDMEA